MLMILNLNPHLCTTVCNCIRPSLRFLKVPGLTYLLKHPAVAPDSRALSYPLSYLPIRRRACISGTTWTGPKWGTWMLLFRYISNGVSLLVIMLNEKVSKQFINRRKKNRDEKSLINLNYFVLRTQYIHYHFYYMFDIEWVPLT